MMKCVEKMAATRKMALAVGNVLFWGGLFLTAIMPQLQHNAAIVFAMLVGVTVEIFGLFGFKNKEIA